MSPGFLTGVEPIQDRLRKNDMVTWDKYARLPLEDNRRKMLDKEVPPRLKTRQGWRWKTRKEMVRFEYNRAPEGRISPPWEKVNIILEAVQLEKEEKRIQRRRTEQERS